MDCTGKTALVAGGLGGIGYATCKALLAKNLKNLGIFDLVENTDLISSLSTSFPRANIKFWKVDATKKDEITKTFQNALEKFKAIDIFVASVGIIDELNSARCVDVNLTATINLNYIAMDYMSISKGGKGGIVVNIASVAGLAPFPHCPTYCATKHGIVGLTRALGNDFYFKTTGMCFIAICPGFTETPLLTTFKGSEVHDVKELRIIAPQTPEICGELLVKAVEKNKNGSIWMINDSKMDEIIIPEYYPMKTTS